MGKVSLLSHCPSAVYGTGITRVPATQLPSSSLTPGLFTRPSLCPLDFWAGTPYILSLTPSFLFFPPIETLPPITARPPPNHLVLSSSSPPPPSFFLLSLDRPCLSS